MICKRKNHLGWANIYTALSRVKTYNNLYCKEKFKKSAIKVNNNALLEYEHLKQNDSFSMIKNTVSDGNVVILVHNMRSFSRQVDDVVRDDRLISHHIIGFTET